MRKTRSLRRFTLKSEHYFPRQARDNHKETLKHKAFNCNHAGDWDPSQAAALLRYSYSQGHSLAGLEYGNELTGRGGIQAQLDPITYAKGFQELRREVDNVWCGNVSFCAILCYIKLEFVKTGSGQT